MQHETPMQFQATVIRERSGALEALEYWTRSRAYPENDISSDKYFKAALYSRKQLKKFPRSGFSLHKWKFLGPNNLAGRTISLAINPLNPNTIYAGSASGGLWRSRSGGQAGDWERIDIGYPVLGVGAIAIAPNDSNFMYIGTGEVYRYGGALGGLVVRTTRGSYGYGIFRSTDAGATWTSSLDWTNDQQRGVQAIKINPQNPNTIWAATTSGIFRSMDAGGSWEQLGIALMAVDLLIHPVDTNRVMFSAGNFGLNPSIYRTTDGGTNWDDVKPTAFTGKTLLAAYPTNPDDVYASIADSTTGVGALWKSSDFGTNWIQLSTASPTGVQGWYSHFVAVHPTDSTQVVWAGVGIQKSTGGGTSFAGSTGSYSDHHAFAIDPFNPNILYVANDDGVYRSTDFGASFAHVSINLNTGQFYNGFSNSATDSTLAIVQSQDHIPGYVYQGAVAWGRSANDEAGWTAIDQSNDNLMYAVSRNGGSVTRSTNRGVNWTFSGSFGGFGAWNSPVVISASNPAVLYVGKDKFFKSTNFGTSWSAVNGNALIDGGNPALSLAVSATNQDTLLVGTAPYLGTAHILLSTNGGTSFTNVTGTLPNRYPTDVAIDPQNSQTMYAVFSGFDAGHIFKSTNAGGSWTDITGSLPDVPTQAIFVDPLNSNYLYAGNDVGVYASTDGGTSWLSFSEGLPDAVLVSDLSYTPSNRTLRCSTHGNGAYEIHLPNVLPSLEVQSPNGGETLNAGASIPIAWNGDLVSMVNLEYSTDDGGTWSPIADSIPAGSANYAWSVPNTNTTTARIRISSVANPAVTDQSDGAFNIFFVGATIAVNNAWNLVSLPIVAFDPRKTSIFPAAVSNAFAYEGSYVIKETLLNGAGYWIKFNSSQSLTLYGDPVANDTIDIVEGWNLIGTIDSSISAISIGSIPGGITTSGFFGYSGNYVETDSLHPGRGYWIKSSQTGQLVLSSPSAAIASNVIRIVPTSEQPPGPPEPETPNLKPETPKEYTLLQNYPNPFNPTTNFGFRIANFGFVSLKVYDMLGREVATIVNQDLPPGDYTRTLDAGEMSSGLYMYRLTAGDVGLTKKMELIK
ncbi:MAG TPA: T9SS type A sorting domain-containing protein [Bacteroidota bacterium]|nr:T9SS type A sorting domain-containing protein [Bacteroidota bacterium]